MQMNYSKGRATNTPKTPANRKTAGTIRPGSPQKAGKFGPRPGGGRGAK